MRQAGRSLPEYRAVRGGRRDARVVPAARAGQRDHAPAGAPARRRRRRSSSATSSSRCSLAGVDVDIAPGRGPGARRAGPHRRRRRPARVGGPLTPAALAPVAEGVALTVAELGATPLLGFAGAPFTLAAYLVEGRPSRDHLAARTLMHADPDTWRALTDVGRRPHRARSCGPRSLAGASAVQLFDSWAGSLSRADYVAHCAPSSARALSHVADLGREGRPLRHRHRAPAARRMRDVGADVVGVDYRTPLDEADRLLGGRTPLQGNIDPALLARALAGARGARARRRPARVRRPPGTWSTSATASRRPPTRTC